MVLEKICMKIRRYPNAFHEWHSLYLNIKLLLLSSKVSSYGKRGYGTLLKKGMCIAIEPMITLGSRQIVMERDGWTVRTRDRKCAAHFEHTVAIGVGKADILSSFEYVEQVLGDKAI